jgi:hypothetical protein
LQAMANQKPTARDGDNPPQMFYDCLLNLLHNLAIYFFFPCT